MGGGFGKQRKSNGNWAAAFFLRNMRFYVSGK